MLLQQTQPPPPVLTWETVASPGGVCGRAEEPRGLSEPPPDSPGRCHPATHNTADVLASPVHSLVWFCVHEKLVPLSLTEFCCYMDKAKYKAFVAVY